MTTIVGEPLQNLPWEERPADSDQIVWRYSRNPIIGWNPSPSTARVFNSAVLPYQGEFVGVFRADHRNGRANLHFGASKDGINFRIEDKILPWQDETGAPCPVSYAYDPRFVKIDDWHYVVWCDDMRGASIGLGKTKDFRTWIRLPNPLLPFNRNGVLFPRKIKNTYKLLSRPSDSGHTPFGDVFVSESPDLIHWGKHRFVMGRGGRGWWQGTKIGAGPTPIETKDGWLLFYHGVSGTCNGFVYSFGAALLDLEEPHKVLYRGGDYLLTPEKDYETSGYVPNVVFPCQNLYDAPSGRIAIYYGAADTFTALAFCRVDEVIDFIKKHHEDVH
ncbi:MAG: glycoside hydrolase family 130 protein [Vicinamibacteria bacterium]|nr:glycoside hydrolase family 130 protein [Vicinamibacteria bacterium]